MAYQYIFGPVLSRRLGVSLGVDLVTHKTCSMDCIYCECGKTTLLTCQRAEYVPFDQVIIELDHYFANHPDPDYITFSGSGEPTLHSRLKDVIDHIKKRRPNVKVSVLTNAGLIADTQVQDALCRADLVIPSLDAVTKRAFVKINRPCADLDVDRIIAGLTAFRKKFAGEIRLEVLILPGINDEKEDILALKQAVKQIRPDRVQLNTLDRPGTLAGIRPATKKELEAVIRLIDFDPIEIIAKVDEKIAAGIKRNDIRQAILETIHRRPCTALDLETILGLEENDITQYLSDLEKEGKVISSQQERGIFYQTRKEGD